jgi:transcriptional regulator GlxA family with amidase domain
MPDALQRSFEIFLSKGFNGLELAAVTHTLNLANDITRKTLFEWRFISDVPGLITGAEGMMVRAEPAIDNYGLSDVMVVIGGQMGGKKAWLKRARVMQRQKRGVVLLSDAATAYIRSAKPMLGSVTTHWQDAAILSEAGYHPNLTSSMAAHSNGVITAGGSAATPEIVIGLISDMLTVEQVAELSNHLLLPGLRASNAEQPSDIAGNPAVFDARVSQAIKLMEATVSDPLPIPELTRQLGLSSRQLERIFRTTFDETPTQYYKRLRTKKARAIIEQTLIPVIDVAVATGFVSADALAKAFKQEFNVTPAKLRARRGVKLMKFDPD